MRGVCRGVRARSRCTRGIEREDEGGREYIPRSFQESAARFGESRVGASTGSGSVVMHREEFEERR